MPKPLQIFKDIATGCQTGEVYRREDLLTGIRVLISSPHNPEVEQLLLALLRFDGEIRLHPESELPHSMSPEEMLKSLAIQTLARWTGLTYLGEMQRVQATAASPVLAGIVRTVIQKARAEKGSGSTTEEVAQSHPVTLNAGGEDGAAQADRRALVPAEIQHRHSARGDEV